MTWRQDCESKKESLCVLEFHSTKFVTSSVMGVFIQLAIYILQVVRNTSLVYVQIVTDRVRGWLRQSCVRLQ